MISRYCSILALVLLLCGWAALEVPCSRRAGRLTPLQHRVSVSGAPRAVESAQTFMQPPSPFHPSMGYARPCASPPSSHPLPIQYYRSCLYTFAPQQPCASANPSTMDTSLLQPVWGPVVTRLEHPLVLPIMHGNFSHQSDGRVLMRPSVTLIIDEIASKGERHHILVDTGLSLYTQFIIDGELVKDDFLCRSLVHCHSLTPLRSSCSQCASVRHRYSRKQSL